LKEDRQERAASPGFTTTLIRRIAIYPETVGAGCAFFDYDNDGWMDIYLVNSGRQISTLQHSAENALYHNNHDGTFTDVTDKAGVAGGTFGMGVAAGDYRWRWLG